MPIWAVLMRICDGYEARAVRDADRGLTGRVIKGTE